MILRVPSGRRYQFKAPAWAKKGKFPFLHSNKIFVLVSNFLTLRGLLILVKDRARLVFGHGQVLP